MDENIIVECSITYKDYKRYSWFTIWNKSEFTKFFMVIWALIFFTLVLLMGYQIVAQGFNVFWDSLSFSAVIAVVAPVLYYGMISASIRKNYRQSKPVLDATKHYEFTSDYVTTDAAGLWGEDGRVGYQVFFKVFQARHAFYLYIGPVQAYIIPIRCMDKGSVQRLGSILKKSLGPKFVRRTFV